MYTDKHGREWREISDSLWAHKEDSGTHYYYVERDGPEQQEDTWYWYSDYPLMTYSKDDDSTAYEGYDSAMLAMDAAGHRHIYRGSKTTGGQ